MAKAQTHLFLEGGGEMGALIAAYNWSATALGSIDTWSESLRTAVSTMLHSRFPMLIFWGPELVTFYNDAFWPSLGDDGKHPGSLGQRGEQSWAESWPVIGPMIYNIMAGGDAVWFEDQKLPLYRDGKMGYAYWTYSFSAIRNGDGQISGLLVTCAETTKAVESFSELAKNKEQLEFAMEGSELAVWDLDPKSGLFTGNARTKSWFGLRPEDEIPLELAINAIAEKDRERVTDAIAAAMQPGASGYNIEYAIQPPGVEQERIVCAKGRAWFNEEGECYRFNGILQDVTEQRAARQRVEGSEAKLRSIINTAPAAIGLFVGRDLVIESPNQTFIDIAGRGWEIVGLPLREAMPELEGQPFLKILDDVYTTGVPFYTQGSLAKVMRNGVLTDHYYNISYSPVSDEHGETYAILQVAIDVTEQIEGRKKLEEAEAKLRSIVSTAPTAIGLFVGRDLVIENPNQTFIDIVGKGWGVEGLPLREAMPELVTEGQPFLKILDDVYTTGVAFYSAASLVKIVQNGVLTSRYYNISYSPVFDAEGAVYAILDVAVDVTELVEAQQKVEAMEMVLREAIDMAELGTWTIDLVGERVLFDDRIEDWFGMPSGSAMADLFTVIPPADAVQLQEVIALVCAPDSDGMLDVEHEVRSARTGRRRIIHSKGMVTRDDEGNALEITGTGQDVTAQKDLQGTLEADVQERTEQLAASNEELQATVEELARTNAELVHSNEELGQYAYVASHDLQEPLRKIQVFSGLLQKAPELSDISRRTLEKVGGSAERMSLLIRDLLAFSRLLRSDSLIQPVFLQDTVRAVWNDFELLVEDKGAQLQLVGELPTIEAVGLQMNQLFYNLIGNALKFTAPERTPVIVVSSHTASQEDVERHILKPLPFSHYCHITVQDNGIGFDAQYNEQIFEVFKRLHGRESYQGSGIGLALCRRIVANHHGYLYALSEPGAGSSFHLLLPTHQHKAIPES